MGRGTTERAGTGGRCTRGARKQAPVPLCRASRPRWGAAAGTAPGAVPLPENSLRPPPHSAAAGGCGAGGKCWGWGRPRRDGGGGGGEARRLLAPSSARDAAAESLSLGHVIVSKRELRGSRRLRDHYKTQPGERVAATAAAASPAPDGLGRAAAAAARTAEPPQARPAPSRLSQTPLPLAPRVQSPRPSAEPAGAAAAETSKLFPPRRPPTALSQSPLRPAGEKGDAGCWSRASFSLPRLSPPGTR